MFNVDPTKQIVHSTRCHWIPCYHFKKAIGNYQKTASSDCL